ncbi:MAG: hypothetical protein KatS3mg083_121 [Candidatus Dojkabacteria bacterium]|nr:MAG: hypothetical protein KatS3mg083_121 [Candidatus Dojkabacteria bacterium]
MARFVHVDSPYLDESDNSQYFHEARYVSIKEWWRITNRSHPNTINTINHSRRYFSAYTIWGHHIVSTAEDNDDYAKQFLVFYCMPYELEVRIDYYSIPENIFMTPFGPNGEHPVGVPVEFEQILIDAVLERVYYKIGNVDRFRDMYNKVKSEIIRLRAIRNQLNITQAISQEALPNPEPSNIPSQIIRQ